MVPGSGNEGNNAYCSYCRLLGHVVGLCRKKAQIQGKAQVVENNPTPSVSLLKRGRNKRDEARRVLRDDRPLADNPTQQVEGHNKVSDARQEEKLSIPSGVTPTSNKTNADKGK